jgi:hypothetical protein
MDKKCEHYNGIHEKVSPNTQDVKNVKKKAQTGLHYVFVYPADMLDAVIPPLVRMQQITSKRLGIL